MKETIKLFFDNRVKFFLYSGIVCLLLIAILDLFFLNKDNISDVIVEAHGMLFDVLLFGIILTLFEIRREEKINKREEKEKLEREIKRYQEEIDDFEGWHEKEASYRIVGISRRLNRLGISKINLKNAYLFDTKLNGLNLKESELSGANLNKCTAIDVVFDESDLGIAKLNNSIIPGGKFRNCKMYGAKFKYANLADAKFNHSDLSAVDFRGARLEACDFTGCDLTRTNFEGADLTFADLSGVKLYLSEKEATEIHISTYYPDYYYDKDKYPLPENWKDGIPKFDIFQSPAKGLDKAVLKNVWAYKSQKKYFERLINDKKQLQKITWRKDPSKEEKENFPWIEWE